MIPIVAVVAIATDEAPECRLQLLWKVVMLKLHHVLYRAVIALDLALGLRVVGSASRVAHASSAENLPEFA